MLTDREKLQALEARINGEWDNPTLVKIGPLLADIIADLRRIIQR